MRHHYTRHQRARRESRRRCARASNSVWPLRDNWTPATTRICIPPGSRSCSTRRSRRRCRGRRCMSGCETSRAISCSTIWVSTKTLMKLLICPDCADLPYFLRAYFAFKMGLPFGYAKCTRGSANEPPKCHAWWNIQNGRAASLRRLNPKTWAGGGLTFGDASVKPRAAPSTPAVSRGGGGGGGGGRPAGAGAGIGYYIRQTLADGVHSGSGRTRGRRRQH